MKENKRKRKKERKRLDINDKNTLEKQLTTFISSFDQDQQRRRNEHLDKQARKSKECKEAGGSTATT